MSRQLLVTLADLHAGHRLGLLNPDTTLPSDDERGHPEPWVPELTATQRWLWECYTEDLGLVRQLADGDPVIVVVVGDLTWGNRYPEQTVSDNVADQALMAARCLEPWVTWPNLAHLRLIHGTQSHEFGRGAMPELVARLLGAGGALDVRAVRHSLLAVDRVEFDLAHHGTSPGIREWTRGNVLEYYTRSVMMGALMANENPPAGLVRGHYHDYVRRTVRMIAGNREAVTEAIVLPGYCGLTHYAVQATRSAYTLACGLVAWEIIDGALAGVHPFWRRVDVRTREAL
jgi:hypothetical protein